MTRVNCRNLTGVYDPGKEQWLRNRPTLPGSGNS